MTAPRILASVVTGAALFWVVAVMLATPGV